MDIQERRLPCGLGGGSQGGEITEPAAADGRNSGQTELKKLRAESLLKLKNAMKQPDQEAGDILWDTLILFQKEPYHTAKGLDFTFTIKGNEMFVTRKDKSITRATVMMSFRKAMELGGCVSGPKKLGTFGASYLYPVFQRIGVIKDIDKNNPLDYDKKEV